jgi:hypothetical protein
LILIALTNQLGKVGRGPHAIEHVFNTFWENTHAVELDDGSGFEMITYDDDDNEESTVISHDAMWQITSGLEPLVGSCAGMMMELMGVGMPPHDHEDDWGEEELNHF